MKRCCAFMNAIPNTLTALRLKIRSPNTPLTPANMASINWNGSIDTTVPIALLEGRHGILRLDGRY